MPSPIKVGGPEFPYHLEIRERKPTRRALSPADAANSQGEYELVLKGDPELLKTSNSIMPQFWAYVLDIDGNGKGAQILLSGTSEHNGGLAKFDATNPPDEIPLTPPNGPPIKFWEPFGTETFVLLVTDRPIDRGLLNFSGVRDLQSSERGDPVSPLDTLLSKIGVNTQTRGEYTSPDTWAVQRLVFATVDGPAKEP